MRRSDLLKLREPIWSTPVNGDPLRCQVVPAADSGLASAALFNVMSEVVAAEFCKSVFVGFEGYTDDDGGEIPNSLESRVELFMGWAPARRMISQTVAEATKDAASGEGDAVSD